MLILAKRSIVAEQAATEAQQGNNRHAEKRLQPRLNDYDKWRIPEQGRYRGTVADGSVEETGSLTSGNSKALNFNHFTNAHAEKRGKHQFAFAWKLRGGSHTQEQTVSRE